jgi:hypothetical protein
MGQPRDRSSRHDEADPVAEALDVVEETVGGFVAPIVRPRAASTVGIGEDADAPADSRGVGRGFDIEHAYRPARQRQKPSAAAVVVVLPAPFGPRSP